ncbi:NUDIX domain-containing protein [Streptosporangium subroseum]|uniref:NUDIX domain-containing protein n=1 Tax=Streptosporangium subroseum TaxID=106412 RepID=UPI003425264C
MAISAYLKWLRQRVGHALVLMPAVTAVIADDEGRILLAEDLSASQRTLPGGAIDPGERPADAVVREMREELGIEVEPTAVLGVFGGPELVIDYPNGDRVEYVTTVFACRIVAGEPVADGEEIARFQFIIPGDHEELRMAPWAHHVLARIDPGTPEAQFDPPLPSGAADLLGYRAIGK